MQDEKSQSEAENNGNNGSGEAVGCEEGETVEEVPENIREKESVQEGYQVEHICFDMLRQQREGKDGLSEKEKGQRLAEDGCRGKTEKWVESEICIVRRFIDWILPVGRYECWLKSKWQLIGRSRRVVFCDVSCKWPIFLWTGVGASLMPP